MSFATSFGPVRAIVFGLALLNASAALAQKMPADIKPTKVKTKTAVGKSKTLSAPGAPRPVSPVASAPQVVQEQEVQEPKNPPTLGLSAADAMADWLKDLSAAQAQAKASNRPVLAVFSGSDWCKPCIIYEQEVFATPEFAAYAKGKLVLAHFDFPRQKRNQPSAAQVKMNEAAAAQLNREGDFPLAVILSPEGKVLAKTGYIAGGAAAFEAYLKKVVPTL